MAFPLGYSFHVKSELGVWYYPREIPYGGEDGPFFDGTLRVQLNRDGVIYAVLPDETRPVVSVVEQPEGYPLKPTE